MIRVAVTFDDKVHQILVHEKVLNKSSKFFQSATKPEWDKLRDHRSPHESTPPCTNFFHAREEFLAGSICSIMKPQLDGSWGREVLQVVFEMRDISGS
jgi:hypothetical protein